MFGLLAKGPRAMILTAALGLLASSSEAASGDVIVKCPEEVTVDWIQAANGKKNTIRTKMRAIVFRDQPNPNMICRFEPKSGPLIQQLVSFKPGSVVSACGAKATITGRGESSGGVPPYEGFVFKSKRIQAVATYDQSTGVCLLTLPVADFEFKIKMTKGCRIRDDYSFTCPGNAYIAN
jgi:hypothetical protein